MHDFLFLSFYIDALELRLDLFERMRMMGDEGWEGGNEI